MKSAKTLFLISVIFLAIVFRFFNFSHLQFWSADEEVMTLTISRIVQAGKIVLVVPNEATGLSLGPFFHYLTALIFRLSSLNASKALLFGSVLGVITTLLAYKTGKALGGTRVGLLTSFLYAASFVVSLYDRRWWPLTPNPFLAFLSFFCLFKILKDKWGYVIPLTIAAGFAWHSDPSLSVIAVFSLAIVLFFRKLPPRNYLILALITLFVMLAPLLVFELRHPSKISGPVSQMLFSPSSTETAPPISLPNFGLDHLTRALFITPSDTAENYFCYCQTYPLIPASAIIEPLILVMLVYPLLKRHSQNIYLPYVFLLAFLGGILFFALFLKRQIYLHYFTVAWPAAFLLVAYCLNDVLRAKFRLLALLFLILYLFFNTQALLYSKFTYPLSDKLLLVDKIIPDLSPEFSLRTQPDNRGVEALGSLFLLRGHAPNNLEYYAPWDWIYRAYSLYPEGLKATVSGTSVYISDVKSLAPSSFKVGNIKASISHFQ